MTIAKKLIIPGAIGLAVFAGVAGGSALSAATASADTSDSSTATATTAADTTTDSGTSSTDSSAADQTKGGHVGQNGTREELLTGDTAAKVKAAAEAAVPGGTVLRTETDAEGAAYEAHVQKSDGSQVTVKFDSNYKVTGTEDGPSGHGPRQSSSSSTTSGTTSSATSL